MEHSRKAMIIKPSATLSLTAKANQMKAEGIDVLGFSAGEPDFDTPSHIKDAAVDALLSGFTKYTPAAGTLELRKAIADDYREKGLKYDYEQIIVSNGGKHSLTNIFLAIINDGDEVIIPSPYWLTYPEIIKIVGGVPVIVRTIKENSFKVTRAELEAVYTEKTKAVIINSPSNPTGAVYSEEELKDIAEFVVSKNILVISDEIYEKLIYNDKKHISIASLGEEIFKRTIISSGLSKTYSMTGFRIGYTAAPRDIAKLISNIQSHSTSNPNSIAQKAAFAAIKGSQDCVVEMKKAFSERLDYICRRIEDIKYISAVKPEGAFYVFVDISKLLGKEINGKKIIDAVDFSDALLDSENCVVVPCNDFDFDDYIRLSYAISMEAIEKGMDRIESFINKYY